MNLQKVVSAATVSLSLFAAACGGAEAAPVTEEQASSSVEASPAAAVPTTGNVIEVKMVTDAKGNYFEPAEIHAKPGDVIRYTLVSGVHNANFASTGSSVSGLPEATPMLQLPGQSHDMVVTMPAGEHKYQCDPHAALGMVGTVTVE